MAIRIPIYVTQSKFGSGGFVYNDGLNARANSFSLYFFPTGNVSTFDIIFGGTPFFTTPVIGRRITRMVVRTKANVFRGAWEWANIILVGPSEARHPINGWQQIPQFCYDPNLPLIPPDGFFEYEYVYPYPVELPPQAYGVELRGVSGNMDAYGAQFYEFQFWDDETATPPAPGGGGDPAIDPNTQIPPQDITTQSYDNLGGSGQRCTNSAGNGGSSIFALSQNFAPDDDSNTGAMLHTIDGVKTTNPVNAWRPTVGAVSSDIAGKYAQFSLRGLPRIVSKVKLTTTETPFGTWRFQASVDETTWTNVGPEFDVGLVREIEVNLGNGTPYNHYRLVGVSGTASSNSDGFYEIEFEISGVPYEKGDRRADMTITNGNVIGGTLPSSGSSSATALFDDDYNMQTGSSVSTATGSWQWSPQNDPPLGRWWGFSFPKPITLKSIHWMPTSLRQTADFRSGIWDLYGSNNNYDWHSIKIGIVRASASPASQFVDFLNNDTPYQHYKMINTDDSQTTLYSSNGDNAEFLFDIGAQFEEIEPSEPVIAPTQDYENLGGMFARADGLESSYSSLAATRGWQIDITTTLAYSTSSRSITRLIEGTRNTGSSPYAVTFTTQAVVDKEIRIEFRGVPRVIDAFRWLQSTAVSMGTFAFEGSDDGDAWVRLHDGAEIGLTTTTEVTFENDVAYRFYRLFGLSGTIQNTPWVYELEFRTGGVPNERGNRLTSITATTDLVMYSSDNSTNYKFTNLIDGLYGSTGSSGYGWRPEISQAVTGKHMTFEFPYKTRVVGLFLIMSYTTDEARTLGVWQPQGSNNGTDWTNIGDTIEITHSGGSYWPIGDDPKGVPFKFFRLFGVSGTTDTLVRYWREFEFDLAPAEGNPFEAEFKDDGEFYCELAPQALSLDCRFTDDSELAIEEVLLDIPLGSEFDASFRDKTVFEAEASVQDASTPYVQINPNTF